jgi:fibronectin type 3 domain-containing protein
MKIQASVFSVLSLVWLGSGGVAEAAIKLDAEQAVLLGGASLPADRGSVSASADSVPDTAARAFDSVPYTTWQARGGEDGTCWIEYRFADDVSWLLTEYTLTNGYAGNRDPEEWELLGSHDGEAWEVLDTKKQQYFAGRQWAKVSRVRPETAFNRYRLKFKAKEANLIELAEVGFTVKAGVMPPREVTVETDRGAVSVKWSPMETATGYAVRRAVDREGPYKLLTSGVRGSGYMDQGPFEEGEMCYYTVSSEKDGRSGPLSTPVGVITPVAAPGDLKAKLGNAVVVLEWTPIPRAVAYVVKRSLLREGPYTTIGTMITSPAYSDEKLSAGTAYHYVVCGVANGKEGVHSAPVSALFPPLAPSGLAAEVNKEGITLTWNAVALAKSYRILRTASDEAPMEEIAMVKGETTFADKAVNYPKTYRYTVAAVNECGISEPSVTVSATPVRPPTWWRR